MTERLKPLDPEHWSDGTRRILGGTDNVAQLEGRKPGGPLNILRTIAHHDGLLEPFLGFASALAMRGVLSRRDSELLALRTAWNCQSAFEWAHHVVYAQAAGVDDDEIARLGLASVGSGWSEADRTLLEAADQLHANQQLDEATWLALRARFDDAQLVEIPFVVGQYTMLSMVANATGVEVEAGLAQLPANT